jgi:succinate dehydrogenase / fumarate reductase, cytochrome b subunit
MSSKSSSLLNSVTKKQLMGITGLLLCGFILTHMSGNLLLFVSSDAFNKYSHTLTSNPLIYVAETILGLLFLSHIFMAIKLVMENRAARPVQYHSRTKSGRGSTFASSTMPISGFITLVFLILHIINLKFGSYYEVEVGGVMMRDMYRTTIEYFADPLHVLFYIVCVTSLGVHVSHGFWSAFQSLGFNHPKYTPKVRILSLLFGVVTAVGFSSFPIFCYIQGGR